MNVALRPPMTQDGFFAWAEGRDERYEFDGRQPIEMTRPNNRHSQICHNLYFALRTRLRGTGYQVLGPDAGVETVDEAVRYPDALVTGSTVPGAGRVVPGVVVAFEVISPGSDRNDRIVKLRDYGAVRSIRRYVIVEQSSIGLTVFYRAESETAWNAKALIAGDALPMPEIGIELPVVELYEAIDFSDAP